MSSDQERTLEALTLRHGAIRVEESTDYWPEQMKPVKRVRTRKVIYLVFNDGSLCWYRTDREHPSYGAQSAYEVQEAIYNA